MLYLPQYGVHLQRDHLSKTADEKVARLTALWVQYFIAAITVRAASVFVEPLSASLACLCVHVHCTYVLWCFLDHLCHRSLSFGSDDALSSQHSMSFCSVVCCFFLVVLSSLFYLIAFIIEEHLLETKEPDIRKRSFLTTMCKRYTGCSCAKSCKSRHPRSNNTIHIQTFIP